MNFVKENRYNRVQIKGFLKKYKEYKSLTSCIDFKSIESESNKERKAFLTEIYAFIIQIDTAISKLTEKERYIIRERYLIDNKKTDSEICLQLKMGRSSFYNYKKGAFDKLGTFLYLLEGDK